MPETINQTINPNARIHIRNSDSHFEKQDYQSALASARSAERISPDCSEILLRIGKIYVMQEQYQEAKTCLERVDKLDPENPDKNYLLGRVHYELAETQRGYLIAADYLYQALYAFRDTENSMYGFFTGLANMMAAGCYKENDLAATKCYDTAVKCFQHALEIDAFEKPSDNIIAYLYNAKAHIGLYKYQEALADWEQAKHQMRKGAYPNLEPIAEEVGDLLSKNGHAERVNDHLSLDKFEIDRKETEVLLVSKQKRLKELAEQKEQLQLQIKSNNIIKEISIQKIGEYRQKMEIVLNNHLTPTNQTSSSPQTRVSNNANSLHYQPQTRQQSAPVVKKEVRKDYSYK